ncbi:MAG: hypothetical protein CL609_23705 [Anaerolineaceae bacterium]|nr:hypothetical protein [Anaerolineaceae bacterium]
MNYLVKIEGQEIPVPEEIGKDDNAVKSALAPFYPQVANAMITRVEKDDTTTITVVKRAGTKGGYDQVLKHLVNCQENKNPAIALYEKIQAEGLTNDPVLLLTAADDIDDAINSGEELAQRLERARDRLIYARHQAAPIVVVGF